MTTDIEVTGQDEEQVRAERCFALDRRIREGQRVGREAMWRVAEAVYEFSEQAGWSALGYETLSDWLADPEVGMTRQTYHRYAAAWRELHVLRQVDQGELQEIDVSKVDLILPAVKSGQKRLKTALDDAKVLGWRDLRQEYTKAKPKAPAPEPRDDGPMFDNHGPARGDVIVVDAIGEHVTMNTSDLQPGEHVTISDPTVQVIVPDAVLADAIAKARDALALPERSGPHRRLNLDTVKAVRAALEVLLDAVDA